MRFDLGFAHHWFILHRSKLQNAVVVYIGVSHGSFWIVSVNIANVLVNR